MPIYEFECQACGLSFEEILPASSTSLPPCPTCKTAARVRKRMSASVRQTTASASRAAACPPAAGHS